MKYKLRSFLSHLLGSLIGYLIFTYKHEITLSLASYNSLLYEIITEQLVWFASAKPLGIKLHISASNIFTTMTLYYLKHWDYAISSFLFHTASPAVLIVALACPLLGIGTCITHAYLALRLAALPLTTTYVLYNLIYKLHLSATLMTWSAIRRKTLLPLFEDHGSSTQLALSALLFMPCLLLLPTTTWYYGFFSVIHVFSTVFLCHMLKYIGCVIVGGTTQQLDDNNTINKREQQSHNELSLVDSVVEYMVLILYKILHGDLIILS